MSRQRRVFTSFLPGVSSDALKRMRKVVRGWRFEVVDMDGWRIDKLLVARADEQNRSVLSA